MKGIILGFIAVVFGLFLLKNYSFWAKWTIEQQNRFWGFHFGDREIRFVEMGAILMGLIFIIIGLLVFFQKINVK